MAHLRTQIRNAMAALVTGLATTGSRVYTTQLYPLQSVSSPTLVIVTEDESIEAVSIGRPPVLSRRLDVSIVALVAATSGHETTLDQVAAEVEAAISADRTLGGIAKSVTMRTLRPSFDASGAQPVGRMEIGYTIDYRAAEGSPETAL